MKFDEKFIEKEIAPLCLEYDKIRGMNVNVSRIAADLIDGLKPVQRRAIYIMYLKDGGKTFRKLATISGEVFGRAHPHSPVAIEDAIVNMEQPWHNTIPLIEGEGNFGSCHDKYTEVLTRNGWKLFSKITYNDLLASVDPETGNMIFEHPVNIIAYPYEGQMICGKHKQGLDFMVTPNHKMVVQPYQKNHGKHVFKNWEFVEAGNIPKYSKMRNRFYQNKETNLPPVIFPSEIISNGNILPRFEISMDLWLQFIGIYLADGCMVTCKKDSYPYIKIIISAVSNPRKLEYYPELFNKMGIHAYQTKGGFNIINKRISDKLISYGLWNKHARFKFVPDFIFDLDKSYIQQFLYGFYMGDGYTIDNTTVYCTSSQQLAEEIQILLMMTGIPSRINRRIREDQYINGRKINSNNMQYQVYSWYGKHQSLDRNKYVTRRYYNDYVYCAEVPTYHTLITRRNGCILLSGNCSGDPAGASRYIKAKLSDYAIACFFEDWKDSVVDMQLAYDEETKIPEYLPAKYPNVLLNGCLGIGFGASCNMFPANFREVVEATIMLMKDPKANIILIPDSPTGASIIATDFAAICNRGVGTYSQRCTYEIDSVNNIITITSVPDQVTVNSIRERIADIKVQGGLSELLDMKDLTRDKVNVELHIREDVNPYKFMRKLIKEVAGLEKAYPVTITITNDYTTVDYSVKGLLLDWIKWRREQKRVSISNKRTTLIAEQRANDVKLFIMDPKNLDDTVKIFRTSRNRAEIEQRLIERYHDTEIRMDSLQARTLSSMRMVDLTIESYEACIKRKAELEEELKNVDEILDTENGIDKVIIAELKDGIKRFGTPRRSNVVPQKISIENEVEGSCILQLSSEGMIIRKPCTNAEEDPIPTDCNGFAIYVNNDESFIIIDENGYHSFVKVSELPVDAEVPLNRYMKKNLDGKIVAMLPVDMDVSRCCTLISQKGVVKRFRINDIGPSKKPCISLDPDDRIVRGIVLTENSRKEILVYTEEGYGQRLLSTSIKITSPMAKGGNGFKLSGDDKICGCFVIDPIDSQYVLYTTLKGKMRLNRLEFLPVRNTKHDNMVNLIQLNDRDKLVSVQGCNKLDKATAYFVDGSSETIDINKLEESTMSSKPKKILTKDMSTSQSNIVKVKII